MNLIEGGVLLFEWVFTFHLYCSFCESDRIQRLISSPETINLENILKKTHTLRNYQTSRYTRNANNFIFQTSLFKTLSAQQHHNIRKCFTCQGSPPFPPLTRVEWNPPLATTVELVSARVPTTGESSSPPQLWQPIPSSRSDSSSRYSRLVLPYLHYSYSHQYFWLWFLI